jgi:anti-sigma B factor antagonist
MSSFYISDYEADGVCMLRVGGYVDFAVAPDLKRSLITCIENGHQRIVVDLSETGFIDSTAIGVLVGAFKRMNEADGELAVVCANENVRSIFEIVGLQNVIPLHRKPEDAVAGFTQAAA